MGKARNSIIGHAEGLRQLVNVTAERLLKKNGGKKDEIRKMTTADWKRVMREEGSTNVLLITTYKKTSKKNKKYTTFDSRTFRKSSEHLWNLLDMLVIPKLPKYSASLLIKSH